MSSTVGTGYGGSYVDDPERLRSLESTGVLHTRVAGIDKLVRIAQTILDVPTVVFTLVTADRQVFIEQVGLPEHWADAGETPLSHSYCRLVVNDRSRLVVSDTTTDARVSANPATEDAGIGAYAGIPVRAADGHILGSFCAIDGGPRDWKKTDLDVLEEIAGAIEAHVQLHATRAELEEQLVAVNLDRTLDHAIASLATATNLSSSVDEIVRAVIEHGQAAVGCALMSVALVENDHLRFYHGVGVTSEVADDWPTAPLDSPVPMAHAVNTGERVVLVDLDAFDDWPVLRDAVADLGIESFAAIPVHVALGDARAVIGVGWSGPLPRGTLPVGVERLAAITRQGLEQAHAHELARAHASMLESIVLPADLPIVPGVESSGIYLPPTRGQRVGGDVYDVVVRDESHLALVIADASGHSLGSSKAITRVRHAMGVLTLEGRRPADVLRIVNTYLSRSFIKSLATACYVLVDTDACTITVSNAGHPQPLMFTENGEVKPVGPAGEQLLGVSEFEYSEETIAFGDNDGIVLFTDGLIERRSEPLEEGEARLSALIAANAERSAGDLTELIERQLPEDREDDVAVLVARFARTELDGSSTEFVWEGPVESIQLADIRMQLTNVLSDLATSRAEEVRLVVTELLTNAIEATLSVGDPIKLSVVRSDAELEVSVENVGPSFVAMPSMPDEDASRGRGLAIASTLSDVTVQQHESCSDDEPVRGVVVRARFSVS